MESCAQEEFGDTKGVSESVYRRRTDNTTAKRKVQKDKQRSTKHTRKTKDRVIRTPLKTGDELRCSGRVSSSCSTNDTRRVNIVTNPVIRHEWGKDREVFMTSSFLFTLWMQLLWSCLSDSFHIWHDNWSWCVVDNFIPQFDSTVFVRAMRF